MFFLLLFIW